MTFCNEDTGLLVVKNNSYYSIRVIAFKGYDFSLAEIYGGKVKKVIDVHGLDNICSLVNHRAIKPIDSKIACDFLLAIAGKTQMERCQNEAHGI